LFDAAHFFVVEAKSERQVGLPKPTLATVFEVVTAGKVYRVTGAALQRWIVQNRSSLNGPKGQLFRQRPGLAKQKPDEEGIGRGDRTRPIVFRSRHLYWVHADDPKAAVFLVAHGSVDAAGGMFGAAAFVVVESLGVVVEVFFGPGMFESALIGPADAVPAVAACRRHLGHAKEYTWKTHETASRPSQ
jgi:hypothetical protein